MFADTNRQMGAFVITICLFYDILKNYFSIGDGILIINTVLGLVLSYV